MTPQQKADAIKARRLVPIATPHVPGMTFDALVQLQRRYGGTIVEDGRYARLVGARLFDGTLLDDLGPVLMAVAS